MRLSIIMVLPLLVPAAWTQTNHIVSPCAYTKVEAGGSNSALFFYNYKNTYMQVHDDVGGRPRLISEIAFRQDGA